MELSSILIILGIVFSLGYKLGIKNKKQLEVFVICFFLAFFLSPKSIVNANLDETIFVIKAVWPSNGQTNVPIDLKSGLTGSSYSNPPGIGNIAIGYGTDLSGGCGNPGHCPEIPDINMGSVNSLTITISSPDDTEIVIRAGGNGTCYGQCYNNDDFYYNFSVAPNVRLKPNTTYNVIVKGGSSGISAHRTVSSGEKDVYLPNDYSWSFTTGDANSAAPVIIPPTSTPKNTPTSTRGSTFNYPTVTLIPTISNKSISTPTIIKRQTITAIATPTVNANVSPTEQKKVISEIQTTTKLSWWDRVKLFWNYMTNKFKKQKPITNTASLITNEQLPTPTLVAEDTPTLTATPTNKPKPKPTVINKPVSVINENILKTKFGINSPDLISIILGDSGKLESYEREYYNQLKGWSELNTTAIEQRIYLPSLNSTKICKTANIVEIKNASINIINLTQQREKNAMFNTKQNTAQTPQSLDEQIQSVMKDVNIAKDTLNELVSKYCRTI